VGYIVDPGNSIDGVVEVLIKHFKEPQMTGYLNLLGVATKTVEKRKLSSDSSKKVTKNKKHQLNQKLGENNQNKQN
jgi:hypothetical protein